MTILDSVGYNRGEGEIQVLLDGTYSLSSLSTKTRKSSLTSLHANTLQCISNILCFI